MRGKGKEILIRDLLVGQYEKYYVGITDLLQNDVAPGSEGCPEFVIADAVWKAK